MEVFRKRWFKLGGGANAHVTTQDAYIALTNAFLDAYPDFFPSHGSIIEVKWNDGELMICLLEGTQGINKELPQKISSYDDKSILGLYIRYRLGISPNHLITMTGFIKIWSQLY